MTVWINAAPATDQTHAWPMDINTDPVRGSTVRKRRSVSRRQLLRDGYRRIFPDIYLPPTSPADFRARSRAAYLLIAETGALAGYSAAELLDVRIAPHDADAEILVPGGDFRERPGLRVHRDRIADDELWTSHGAVVTSPLRTAFDLARWLPLVDAVVATDALARTYGFQPWEINKIYRRYPRSRWRRRVSSVLDLADPLAESPMETRTRLALVLRGLPKPASQFWVEDGAGRRARLDLAYPEALIGIEYDGDHHRAKDTYADDRRRENWLHRAGWLMLHFTATDVFTNPEAMAAQVADALKSRQGRQRPTAHRP